MSISNFLEYHIITDGYSGRMARFDEDGRFVEWTEYIRKATCFQTRADAALAVRALCRAELEEDVRKGRASRVLDEDSDEVMYVNERGYQITPRMRGTGARFLTDEPGPGRVESVRQFVRGAFADAGRQNTSRSTAALIRPSSTPQEYTMTASQRARTLATHTRHRRQARA